MISGVPVAAISPMKATLEPMLIMLLKDRNQGDSSEKATSSAT